ncbi:MULTISPECIES: polyamine ABC transporter substrate-binding protein [unclassified Pseudomonas]|uniref:polyamine ABC transporter substrate-binding protein n=1 Tax=unclassified Pseudomonas TaxID=196821 RepID=UPI000871271E|nr:MULTISPECIES: polyamine ABC transporter substrate-binding protein [unclassified Pseudomonas]SCW30480.1 putrescine transport system substrate-binding protein [Pseudomonas sp. NFACC56-3]SFK12354.1 putrescine transport system substrate-binding protein [Pseudomonas sp. NFACC52]
MNMLLRNTLLGAVVSMLVSGASLAEERTVRIYNWIEYLPPEILKSFEEETGIRPIYDVFDSVETLESKLLTGNSGYDVVYPSSTNVSHLIAAGAVEPLDRSQLSNWQHLDPEFMKSLEAVGDPGNRYAAPYLWGTTLIGYNVDKVRQVLGADVQMNTWDILFKEENMAKLASCGVGLLDAANEIVPIALHYEGLDPNSQKREDYAKAQAAMLKVRPYITYFNSSRYGMDLANGEICVGVGWSGGVALAKRLAEDAGKGVKVEMVLPKEGAPMWSDVMMVPANAPHAKEAYAFINYILRPDVIARISNKIGYPNPNKDATALVNADIRNNPAMYVPDEARKTLFALEPVPAAVERIRTRTWIGIKTHH